jgi:hypothetical protein
MLVFHRFLRSTGLLVRLKMGLRVINFGSPERAVTIGRRLRSRNTGMGGFYPHFSAAI